MADIELSIKIPEETYEAICNENMLPLNLINVIKNGTLLSEHDRLVDAAVVASNIEAARYELGECDEGLNVAWRIVNSEDAVPTIIPATKEGEK